MNDSLSVQILKTFEYLFDVNGDKCLWEAPKLLVKILKRTAFDELKNDA